MSDHLEPQKIGLIYLPMHYVYPLTGSLNPSAISFRFQYDEATELISILAEMKYQTLSAEAEIKQTVGAITVSEMTDMLTTCVNTKRQLTELDLVREYIEEVQRTILTSARKRHTIVDINTTIDFLSSEGSIFPESSKNDIYYVFPYLRVNIDAKSEENRAPTMNIKGEVRYAMPLNGSVTARTQVHQKSTSLAINAIDTNGKDITLNGCSITSIINRGIFTSIQFQAASVTMRKIKKCDIVTMPEHLCQSEHVSNGRLQSILLDEAVATYLQQRKDKLGVKNTCTPTVNEEKVKGRFARIIE